MRLIILIFKMTSTSWLDSFRAEENYFIKRCWSTPMTVMVNVIPSIVHHFYICRKKMPYE